MTSCYADAYIAKRLVHVNNMLGGILQCVPPKVGKSCYLVCYSILVGEPLLSRQVLINRWNNLQYVVMRGQSCLEKK